MAELFDDLRAALNKHCAENVSNTPDRVLALFLMHTMAAFNTATLERDAWYKRTRRQVDGAIRELRHAVDLMTPDAGSDTYSYARIAVRSALARLQEAVTAAGPLLPPPPPQKAIGLDVVWREVDAASTDLRRALDKLDNHPAVNLVGSALLHMLTALVLLQKGQSAEAVQDALDQIVKKYPAVTIVGEAPAGMDAEVVEVREGNQTRYTDRLKTALDYAAQEAADLGHSRVSTAHLVLGLLREGDNIALAVGRGLGWPVDRKDTLLRARNLVDRLMGSE